MKTPSPFLLEAGRQSNTDKSEAKLAVESSWVHPDRKTLCAGTYPSQSGMNALVDPFYLGKNVEVGLAQARKEVRIMEHLNVNVPSLPVDFSPKWNVRYGEVADCGIWLMKVRPK